MPFDLNTFRTKLSRGGARPNQFEMRLKWPDAISGSSISSTAESTVRYLCSVSEIPGSTVGEIPVSYMGRKVYYAGDREFEPLSVTILNDEDFMIRRALEYWLQAIQDHGTTVSQFNGSNTSGSYTADAQLVQLSRNEGGGLLRAYNFVGLFPTKLSPIALDWSDTDKIETFTCTFRYQWWQAATADVSMNINITL